MIYMCVYIYTELIDFADLYCLYLGKLVILLIYCFSVWAALYRGWPRIPAHRSF